MLNRIKLFLNQKNLEKITELQQENESQSDVINRIVQKYKGK